MADILIDASLSGSSTVSPELLAGYRLGSALPGSAVLFGSVLVTPGYQAPVRYQPSCRSTPSGVMIQEQVDLFLEDGKTRAQGVVPADLQLKIFLDGSQVDWPLLSGVGINDPRVTAGRVYWSEFTTGFYYVRFFPNRVGTWRLVITYPAKDQAVSLSYAVSPQYASPPLGMRASFLRR